MRRLQTEAQTLWWKRPRNISKRYHNLLRLLARLQDQGMEKVAFEHFKVNQKYNFVDPDTVTQTQIVERM